MYNELQWIGSYNLFQGIVPDYQHNWKDWDNYKKPLSWSGNDLVKTQTWYLPNHIICISDDSLIWLKKIMKKYMNFEKKESLKDKDVFKQMKTCKNE